MPYMELALPCMGVFETQKLRFLLIAVDALWAPNMETSNKRRNSKLLTVNRDPVLLVALPTGYLRLPCLYSTTTYSDSLLTLCSNTGHASLTIHDDNSAHSKQLGHVRSHPGAQARHPLCRGSMCHLHASWNMVKSKTRSGQFPRRFSRSKIKRPSLCQVRQEAQHKRSPYSQAYA